MKVRPGRSLGRALVRRCPSCGARGIFRSYFRLRDRCPACGYDLVGGEGFFLGVWVINFAVSEGLLFIVLMGYVITLGASGGDVPVLPVLLAALGFAVVAPVVVYPFAAATWSATELVMHPERARPALGGTTCSATRLAAGPSGRRRYVPGAHWCTTVPSAPPSESSPGRVRYQVRSTPARAPSWTARHRRSGRPPPAAHQKTIS